MLVSQDREELLGKMVKLAQLVRLAPLDWQEKEESRGLLVLQDFRAYPVLQVLQGKGANRVTRAFLGILEPQVL